MSEEQELSVEKSSFPVVGEKVDFRGQTYECVNVDWDRKADEITAIYRNVSKEDPDYSQYAGHFLSNGPDAVAGSGVDYPDRNVINIEPDHPSARYETQSYPRRPIRDNPQA
jgi:hypothetical protein